MKILRIEKGKHEIVHTDLKPEGSGIFQRVVINGKFPTVSWFRQIDRNGGTWLRLPNDTNMEDCYQEFMRQSDG